MNRIIFLLLALFSGSLYGQIRPDTVYTVKPASDSIVLVYIKGGETVRMDVKKVKRLKKTKWTIIKDKIEVRQTFQSKKDREEAAFINLVYPKDSVKSKNFSFAIGYNIWAYDKEPQLVPYFEWQANTLAAKEQDAIFAGLAFQAPLRGRNSSPLRFFTIYAISAVNYKKDDVKKTKGMQANLYFSPVFAGSLPLPDVEYDVKFLKLIYNAYAGLEYEDRAKTKEPLHQGTAWRLIIKANAKIYPLSTLLKSKLEIVPEIAYRNKFSGTTTVEKKLNTQKKIAFNIILLDRNKDAIGFDLKLGFDHTQGADPTKGFDDQRVNTLSLKLKF
jgi:hypothetical protein